MRLCGIALIAVATLCAQPFGTVQLRPASPRLPTFKMPPMAADAFSWCSRTALFVPYVTGSCEPETFLDIRSKTSADGERGLLGLAFPAGFAQKQRFYVDYTDLSGNTVIAQYRMAAGGQTADAASETVLLKITQPFSNHNGGQVRFGPDGYLYIGMGDGGSAGDPMGNGQNLGVLLGKILRVDVESEPGTLHIPASNPFANTPGLRGEIWASGLRNPWRFSFDRDTRDLWIADVGQGTYEELDLQPAASRGGENYGWGRYGGHALLPGGACRTEGLTLPVFEYTHAAGDCSVTGGFVYRGQQSPGLRGLYLYGDYCTGKIWALEPQGTAWSNRLVLSSGLAITTFGEDEAGEIYVANGPAGTVFRIEGSTAPRLTPERGHERGQLPERHGGGIAGDGVRGRRARRGRSRGGGPRPAAARARRSLGERRRSGRAGLFGEQCGGPGAGEFSGAV